MVVSTLSLGIINRWSISDVFTVYLKFKYVPSKISTLLNLYVAILRGMHGPGFYETHTLEIPRQ